MAKLDTALWRDMMSYLRQRHAPICRQWFEELEPETLESGLLRISTRTSVQQNYLQQKCRDQFTEAAQAVTGNLVAVNFVNERSPAAPTPASGNDSDETASTIDPSNNGHDLAEPSTDNPPQSRSGELWQSDAAKPAALPATNVRPPVRKVPIQPLTDIDAEQTVLSPDYSFDNFITGPNNRLAYAAAVAVANQPGTAYNPLFIHGGVGLGKTHLLQAICQNILDDTPDTNILYVSCDVFMNQFIECVQSGQMNQFRHRYRHVDLLVIDDIHFLGNRERSQEEFFHTFNELYQSNRQIVLSSDAAPSEIPHLEERLVSRFQWGLVTTVTKPSYETRVAILHAKAKLRGIDVPEPVISYVAGKVDSNARELEGAIITLQAHAQLQNRPVDLTLAREALGDPAGEPRTNQATLQNIIDAVTAYYNVKLSDLQSRRRHKSVTEPRQVCMWLARKRTRFSLEEIGGYFGGRDHTTVMHAIRIVDDRAETDSNFGRQVEKLDDQVQRSAGEPH